MDFDDLPGLILDHMCALDEVCIPQAYLITGVQAIIFRRRCLTKVVLLDVEHL